MIVVNTTFKRVPFADVLFAMDRVWWDEYADQIDTDAELWTTAPHVAKTYGLNLLHSEAGGGVSGKPGTIRQGGNSGFQAVGMALHFGAARVILLGFDMQYTDGRSHWHGDHPAGLGNPVAKRMAKWLENFGEMANQAKVPIVNATRRTALECFPRVELKDALCGHS